MARLLYPQASDLAILLNAAGAPYKVNGSGQITTNGLNLTGTNTQFMTNPIEELKVEPGDILIANNQYVQVATITDDRHGTLQNAFNPDITEATSFQHTAVDLISAAAAAIEDWERMVNTLPFIADSVASIRYYNPPRGIESILFIEPCIEVDQVAFVPFGSDPYVFTVGLEYILLPLNCLAMRQPITGIQWTAERWVANWYPTNTMDSLQVTAKWGYQTEIPENAWQAVGALALLNYCIPWIQQQGNKGIKSLTVTGDVIQFLDKTFGALITELEKRILRTKRLYRRMTL